jgi:hypothetical protein
MNSSYRPKQVFEAAVTMLESTVTDKPQPFEPLRSASEDPTVRRRRAADKAVEALAALWRIPASRVGH